MDKLLEAVKPLSTHRMVRKNSVLIYQGEIPRSVFIIKRGMVKAYTLTNTGNEQVVAFFGPGEPLAPTWAFGKTSNSLYYYETVEDTEFYTIARDQFQKIIEEDKHLKDNLFEYFIVVNSGLLLRITALEQQRAVEKIAFTLYYLMFRYGEVDKDGQYHITLKLTHNSIASLVGLTRETTATELSKLKQKGVLDYNSSEYVIDKAKLERIMGEDAFSDLELK